MTLEEIELAAGGQDTSDSGYDGDSGDSGDGSDGGGDDGDIVVHGNPPDDDGFGDDGDDGDGDGGDGGGNDGSNDPMAPYKVADHTKECGMLSGDAVDVAQHVMGQNGNQQVTTADDHNYTNVEFSAILTKDADGKFGALDSAIFSENDPNNSVVPGQFSSDVYGDWHNHPLRGDANQQRIDEFTTRDDWDILQDMANESQNSNPSMFITDGAGTMREFQLSDKGTFYDMTNAQLADPNNQSLLNGRTRTDHC